MTTKQKITAAQLKEFVQKELRSRLTLKEDANDFVPGADKKLSAYVEKCDKAMEDCRKKIKDLMDEGEELVKMNLFKDSEVGERNRLLFHYIGALKKYHSMLVASIEALRRGF